MGIFDRFRRDDRLKDAVDALKMMQSQLAGKAKERSDDQYNADGWGNVLSGFGGSGDKSKTTFTPDVPLTEAELINLWQSDSYAYRTISVVSEDMIRRGFSIVGDNSGTIRSELTRLNYESVFRQGMDWSQLYGGAAIYMSIDDGMPPDMPVQLSRIKRIRYLKAYRCIELVPDQGSLVTDIDSDDYGKYMLYDLNDGIGNASIKIHASRLLPIIFGTNATNFKPALGRYWGVPVLNRTKAQLSSIGILEKVIANLVSETSIGKYKLSNVAQMIASGNEDRIVKRVQIIALCKSIINGVILDADGGEDYTRDTLNFAGISGVSDMGMILLSGASSIPVTRLFGRSPSGLDASGDSDLAIYYDHIASLQTSMLTTLFQTLVFYINKYKKSIKIEDSANDPIDGRIESKPKMREIRTSDEIHIDWNSLYQMTDKQRADMYFTNAQADMYYINAGVVSREEVRVKRLLGGYNSVLSVETRDIVQPEEDETDITGIAEESDDPGSKEEPAE